MSSAGNPLTAISTWSTGPAHSSIHFKVRHMIISNVCDEFRTVRGLAFRSTKVEKTGVDALHVNGNPAVDFDLEIGGGRRQLLRSAKSWNLAGAMRLSPEDKD